MRLSTCNARGIRSAFAGAVIVGVCVATTVVGQANANTGTVSGVSAGTDSQVLILGSSVIGGGSSLEATAVTTAGLTPVVVDNPTWSAMSTADFASYRAIVIGDPECGSSGADSQTTAESTVAKWAPALDGNVIINGTDPEFHSGSGGGALTDGSVKFAVAQAGKTGAYISLSCYYNGAAETAVAMLAGVGTSNFVARGTVGGSCYNTAHIVATHPALSGINDGTLSGWSCSVHEEFSDWPAEFTVLAIAQNSGTAFTASDGSVGSPYILARGAGLVSSGLSVTPSLQERPVNSTATLTAHLVNSDSNPVSGAEIRGRVLSGPHAGTALACSPCTTDPSGNVVLTYPGTVEGTDSIQVWRETTADGVPGSGEARVTAAVTWGKATVVGKPDPTKPAKAPRCFGKKATIVGTANSETIIGTPGPDVIVANSGNDVIKGRGGADRICGNRGNDRIFGGKGADQLFGGLGDDNMHGGKGADHLRGGRGQDNLDGGSGNNSLTGGPAKDSLNGGPGKDECTNGDGHDKVKQCEDVRRGD